MFYQAKEVNDYLQKIQQGDKTQIEPLFKITILHMHNIAQYYLVNKSLAKDVASEAFLKLLNSIDTYDCSKDGYNWMWTITKNLAFDFNKKEAKVAAAEQQFAREADILGCNHDLDEIEFAMLIEPLEETDRFIAYKKYVEGYTLEEIGRELNLSKVAVHQRIKKIGKTIKRDK